MRRIDDNIFALRHRSGSDPPISEIVLHGRATGKMVRAAFLEAAVKAGEDYLVFTTDDVPYEEVLSVHLIDDIGDTLETLWMGCMYSSGDFERLEIIDSDSVRFRFIGDFDWTVRITPSPRFRIPYPKYPCGVWRPFTFRSRLVVKRRPKPDN